MLGYIRPVIFRTYSINLAPPIVLNTHNASKYLSGTQHIFYVENLKITTCFGLYLSHIIRLNKMFYLAVTYDKVSNFENNIHFNIINIQIIYVMQIILVLRSKNFHIHYS